MFNTPAATTALPITATMGPPIAAPGQMCIVGGMGLLAALMRREK